MHPFTCCVVCCSRSSIGASVYDPAVIAVQSEVRALTAKVEEQKAVVKELFAELRLERQERHACQATISELQAQVKALKEDMVASLQGQKDEMG